jgi:chromosomal replication initiation ATPase DnaA
MKPDERHQLDCARARFACNAAAFALGVKEDLLGPDRGSAPIAFARQVAMYLTHVAFGMSLHRVAVAFARDRSTVAYACHLIEDRRDDPKLDDMLDQLEAAMRAAPMPANFVEAIAA